MMVPALLALLALLAPAALADGGPTSTWDDLAVADDDLLSLEQHLTDKWLYFTLAMDKYNHARSSENNAAMEAAMAQVFAPTFTFAAVDTEGEPLLIPSAEYTPASWVVANDVSQFSKYRGTLYVTNYWHILSVEVPGERVVLEGYHEHSFTEVMAKLVGHSRAVAFDHIVFEKVDGAWRITDYTEVVEPIAAPARMRWVRR
ncbi:MAG: hypothetical protein H6739_08870 [Alphaproteobacteria bacterium]|nr:hypothetical protein [Alphaproteobacteria bacterium]